jgi:hypothetical protein
MGIDGLGIAVSKPPLTLEQLKVLGFRKICHWIPGGKRGIIQDGKINEGGGLYAFVPNDVAKVCG